jgi:hypothetical protein
VNAEEERGGGPYRRRDCSGEVVEGVGEVSRVMVMCGSESAGPRAQAGELIGGEESGLTRARLVNQMGQGASPAIKEGVCARN